MYSFSEYSVVTKLQNGAKQTTKRHADDHTRSNPQQKNPIRFQGSQMQYNTYNSLTENISC